jgi:TRAP-type C4-dicarboxylate transport system permease small subunit
MNFLKKLDGLLAFVEKAVVVVLFASLVLLISINIFLRNLFDISIQTILELSPVLVLWISLTGATLALKTGRHIKLEILLRYVKDTTRLICRVISGLFGTIVMAILFFASISFVKNEWAIFGIRAATSIVFPLFFAISCFRYLLSSLKAIAEPEDAGNMTYKKEPPQSHTDSAREDL